MSDALCGGAWLWSLAVTHGFHGVLGLVLCSVAIQSQHGYLRPLSALCWCPTMCGVSRVLRGGQEFFRLVRCRLAYLGSFLFWQKTICQKYIWYITVWPVKEVQLPRRLSMVRVQCCIHVASGFRVLVDLFHCCMRFFLCGASIWQLVKQKTEEIKTLEVAGASFRPVENSKPTPAKCYLENLNSCDC